MPYKDKLKAAEAKARHFQENKDRYREKLQERRRKLRQWFKEYKSKLKCNRCPENHPGCLQFHHKDRSEKEITIAQAICAYWSKERILAEIAKCEVLCANCHQKEHWVELDIEG